MNRIYLLAICCLQLIIVSGCNKGKQPLHYGKDACDYCKMMLMDPAFGGELITQKGKIYKFDDTGCMLSYLKNMDTTREPIAEAFVVDHAHPGTLIRAESSFYLQSDKVKSPMASGIAAFSSAQDRYAQQQEWQGKELTWSALKGTTE